MGNDSSLQERTEMIQTIRCSIGIPLTNSASSDVAVLVGCYSGLYRAKHTVDTKQLVETGSVTSGRVTLKRTDARTRTIAFTEIRTAGLISSPAVRLFFSAY